MRTIDQYKELKKPLDNANCGYRPIDLLSPGERSALAMHIGQAMLNAPIAATIVGHDSALDTLTDYFRATPTDSTARIMAAEFLREFGQMHRRNISVFELAAKWSPSQDDVVKKI